MPTLTKDMQFLRDVFYASPTGIAVENFEGQPIFVNPAFCRFLGFTEEELRRKHCVDFSPKEDAEKDWALFQQLRAGAINHYQLEKRYFRRDGSLVWGSLSISLLNSRPSPFVIAMVEDITDKKQAEEALRESEEKFHNLFRDAGLGMVIVSLEGRFLAANGIFCDCLGYTNEEILTKTVESVTFPEDWPAFSQKLREALTEECGFRWFEKRCLHKSGRIVRTQSSACVIRKRNGEPRYFVGQVLDVTQRKDAEEALSQMTQKLIEAQEQERARIGRELYDDINQRLAMVGIELDLLANDPTRAETSVLGIRKQVMEISSDVQALSHELHSWKLEYLGVVAGMKSSCMEFAKRQAMEVDFNSDLQTAVPLDIGLPLFRVLQEALHNVIKHSGVRRAEVQLRENSGQIHLIISDLGRGFDVQAAAQGKGIGLTSMRERVRLVNGTITIDSKPIGGTIIHVCVPLRLETLAPRAVG